MENVPTKHFRRKWDTENFQGICLGLVQFQGISTFVGYLMPNPLYTYILNIYDLVWLGFMANRPLQVI